MPARVKLLGFCNGIATWCHIGPCQCSLEPAGHVLSSKLAAAQLQRLPIYIAGGALSPDHWSQQLQTPLVIRSEHGVKSTWCDGTMHHDQ